MTDAVREVVETLVLSRLEYVEAEVKKLNTRLEALTDVYEALGKPFLRILKSEQDPAVTRYANTLKGWTGTSTASVVYDSRVNPFTDQGLFDKVKGKANIALITFTSDGDVFGGFFNVAMTEQDKDFKHLDIFIFLFDSHGRCATPQRFAVKEEDKQFADVCFWKNDSDKFVWFWGCSCGFFLGNERSNSICEGLSLGL